MNEGESAGEKALSVRLVLVDPNPTVCAAFSTYFGALPKVEIVNGRFEDLSSFDCLVSAANSFGFMSGGVDTAIVAFFGERLQQAVTARLRDEYLGEQPVGTSMIVETGDTEHPYVAHTPTMRIPMPVARTDYAYLAMWAVLLAVRAHNRAEKAPPIRTLACPGLCTATGRMPPEEAARQMAYAYKNFVSPPSYIDWKTAYERQDTLGRGGDFAFPPRPSQA